MQIRLGALLLSCSLAWQCGIAHISFNEDNPGKYSYRKRVAAADHQAMNRPWHDKTSENNGDESNVSNFAGSFTKTFAHDATTGEVTEEGADSFRQLVQAMASQLQSDFNAITRYSGSSGKLINPQGALAASIMGAPTWLIEMPTPPALESAEAAANLIECYLHAVCRDIRFEDYGTGDNSDDDGDGGSLTEQAAQALTALGDAFKGARTEGGEVTPALLFRGRSAGDRVGPHVSQFLLQSFKPYNQALLAYKQYMPIAQQREFGVSWSDFVAIQNGLTPKPYTSYDFDQVNKRYIITGRDLATCVHSDWVYESFYNAVLILAGNGFPFSSTLPYANGSMTNEVPFTTMGMPDALAMVGAVSKEALKAAWAHKWLGSRILRPDAMAGLVHRAVVTESNSHNLHSSLFTPLDGIDVLAWVNAHNLLQAALDHDALSEEDADTYLLGMVYPEGSPAHPSYPSGHATIAGACVTVIKAIYNDTTKINAKLTPKKADPADATALVALSGEGEADMTVGGELDKLASHLAIGRNWAGIHYRWDAEEGILLGEQVALAYLQDVAREYAEENFTGFELTKRDGTRVRVTADAIVEVV